MGMRLFWAIKNAWQARPVLAPAE